MARKPSTKKPAAKGALPRKPTRTVSPAVKAAADRAAARASGKALPDPKSVPISAESKAKIDPPIVPMGRPESTEGDGAAPSAGGRPTKYRDEFVDRAREMCANGATDFEIAMEFGVTTVTIWRWSAKYPEFCKALSAKSGYDDRVERKLAERALGYSYHTEKVFQFQGQPVRVATVEHVPPDPGAAKLWLTNRRPKEWRESTQRIEHTGRDGGPIEIEGGSDIQQARLVAFALGRALERVQKLKTIDAE